MAEAQQKLYECLSCKRDNYIATEARALKWVCQCGGKIVAVWWGKSMEVVQQ